MRKIVIVLVLALIMVAPVLAEASISGHIQSQVKFDFSNPDEQTLKYDVSGSFASFTIDLTELSLSKKGTKKPYVDISASVALQFNVGDKDIQWATYVFPINQADITGIIRLNKFNLVADVAGKEMVVDFLHNNIGGDWAKSPFTKFRYTTADLTNELGILNPDIWSSGNVDKASFTYNNMIHEEVRRRPGFTITYDGWSTGASFDLTWGENEYGFFSLGTVTPDFKFGDRGYFKASLGVRHDADVVSSIRTSSSLIGGSFKGGIEAGKVSFSAASDYGVRIDAATGEETEIEFDGIDAYANVKAYVADLGVYYTMRTPILGHKAVYFGLDFADPEIESLISINDVLSAKLELDFHKLEPTPVPLIVSATLLDVLYTREDAERDDIFTIAEEGTTAYWGYAGLKAISRYGRDLDVDASTDAFAKQHISKLWVFGHKLLQTKEFGAGIEFTFGNLVFGDIASYETGTSLFWDKAYIEYKPETFRTYAAAQISKRFNDDSDMTFAAIAGISSNKLVDMATVGAEFRYQMDDYDSQSAFPDSCKDFTVYCKVDF